MQCPRLAGNVGEGPFGRPLHSCRAGTSPHTQLWGFRLAWPPLWVVSCPCCHCAEGLGGARLPSLLVCANPSLTQQPCHSPGAGTWLEVGAGATGVALALPRPSDVCLFVCSVGTSPLLSCVCGGWGALGCLSSPQPCTPCSSWLCLSCALQGPLVWAVPASACQGGAGGW